MPKNRKENYYPEPAFPLDGELLAALRADAARYNISVNKLIPIRLGQYYGIRQYYGIGEVDREATIPRLAAARPGKQKPVKESVDPAADAALKAWGR